MRRKTKKVIASVMAALMMLSLAPVSAFNGVLVNDVVAADLDYEGLDLTGGVVAGESFGGSLGLQSLTTADYKVDKKSIDGTSYPGYINFTSNTDGKNGSIPTKNAYKIQPSKDGDISIAFKLNAGKTFYLVKEDGTVIETVANTGTASAFYTKTFSLTAGETYYMYSGGNKLFIYGVEWNGKAEAESAVPMGAKKDGQVDTTSNGNITYLGAFTAGKDGGNSSFDTSSFVYDDAGNNMIKASVKHGTTDIFTSATDKTLKDSIAITKGAIKYEPEENGLLILNVKINKNSATDNKPFYVISVSPTGKTTLVDYQTESASYYGTKEIEVKAGFTYYIGQTAASLTVFKMTTVKGTIYDITPWDEVQTPVITDVVAATEGFSVTVSGVVDKYKGAENIVVTMLHNGGQAGETTITKSKGETTVSFTAYDSGDYTFVATAQRTGCPDKISDTFSNEASTNFILGVRKPVISWAQNKGNGTVYLDWVNISDASDYTLSYKEKGAEDSTAVKVENIKNGDYTVDGLTVDKTYTFSVTANRADGRSSEAATKDVTVTAGEDQNWYISTVGSAQVTEATITKEDNTTNEIKLESSDTAKTKADTVEADDISNTKGSIALKGQTSGKISDDEDGFSYYYTKVDPETENFEISATFTITDTSLTPDNQTGFGVVVADIIGTNFWGKPDYTHKYFNYFSSLLFSATKQDAPVMRSITGYTSSDTSNKDGVERVNSNIKFSDLRDSTKSDSSSPNYIKDAYAMYEKGNVYTFTVKKTDEGYEATATSSKGTQTQKLSANDFTSVQEDGTVCVGIMVSRKISVDVTNITFTKSASKGLATEEKVEDKITPSITVYSSGTCGADEYEYIAVPNCAGTLTVSSSAGGDAVVKEVTADEVVRVNVPVNEGSNTITAKFAPKAADNIKSTDEVSKDTTVTRKQYGYDGHSIIVSPDGKSTGDGTAENPLDLNTALSYARPGQTIIMKNGKYTTWGTIPRSVSGTAQKPITLVAESVSTDGENGVVMSGAGLSVIGSYWHVYGIYVKDSTGVGIQVSGNYNTIEMCTVEHSANSGIQLSRSGSADNTAGIKGELWPTGNLVKNCESFDNCDSGRNDADGFAAKLTCGEGNKFYGCISHNNIDDGWDLYAKSVSGIIGVVTIENCVAYNNGWLTFEDPAIVGYGEGNGFKLGGGYLKGGHKLINCVAFGNHAKGITSNSCPDISITSCTAYGNGNASSYSIGLNAMTSALKEWKVKGLISMTDSSKTTNADLIPFSQHGADNYIYNGSESYNNLGEKATNDWFESVDMTKVPTRNENGTINMNGLLVIKSGALADGVGARLDTTSEAAISVMPEAVSSDHVYGKWTVTKEPTCTEKGSEHSLCTICGYEETREVEALGHEYSKEFTVDKEATTSEEGSKSHHCTREGCTAITDVTVIPKLEAPKAGDISTEVSGDMKDSVKVEGTEKPEDITEFTASEIEAINNGATAKIEVNIEDVSETVSKEDKEKVDDTLKNNTSIKDNNYVVGSYIDIEVIKKIGNDATKLSTTVKELQFVLNLPDNLINKDSSKVRTYKVLRIHDGNVDIIDAVFDAETGKLSFKSDKFSTYAIIYSDAAVEDNDENTGSSGSNGSSEQAPPAQTGDSMNAAPFALAMIISAGFVILAFSRKRRWVK